MKPIRFSKLDDDEREKVYGSSRISLCQKPNGVVGREYLMWERGLDEGAIANFRLGFVPFEIDHPFSGRVVMPIFDAYSHLLALSCRPIFKTMRLRDREIVAIKPQLEGNSYSYFNEHNSLVKIPQTDVIDVVDPEPKYWNESFSKGEHLFGLQLAKYDIIKLGFAILCEGQFDVMAMHAHGFKNTVGLCGGAFTPRHAMLIRQWANRVVILLDGDKAGRTNAQKAKVLLDAYGFYPLFRKTTYKDGIGPMTMRQYDIVTLPDGHDPDSFLRVNGSYLMSRLIADTMAQAA